MTLRLNWGTGVALAYLLFAGSTTAFVAFALGRHVDLVAPDYYARSLRQDQQMAAARLAGELGGAASVTAEGDDAILVTLPASHATAARGCVTLYRASDASADRVIDLRIDGNGRQVISLDGLPSGLWSVRVRWTAHGREFYFERRLVTR